MCEYENRLKFLFIRYKTVCFFFFFLLFLSPSLSLSFALFETKRNEREKMKIFHWVYDELCASHIACANKTTGENNNNSIQQKIVFSERIECLDDEKQRMVNDSSKFIFFYSKNEILILFFYIFCTLSLNFVVVILMVLCSDFYLDQFFFRIPFECGLMIQYTKCVM